VKSSLRAEFSVRIKIRMESLVLAVATYGYSILFFVVFAESIGLPIPAAVALLAAGAASAHGTLPFLPVVLTGVAAMLIGDNLLFFLGRHTGWWLLSMLCRFSLNPEACILRSADAFYRRGRIILLFAKFLPGLNTMAPPLAGSMNLPFVQFFSLDLIGASVYVLTYFTIGFLFSDFLASLLRGYSVAGNVLGLSVTLLFSIWLANRIRLWLRARGESPVPLITPEEVVARDAAIFDVRTEGYYEDGTLRIKGSKRLELGKLEEQVCILPRDREIVLYCTCVREASAIHVARVLAEKGIPSAVIEGGLNAWKKASLPLEPVPADEVISLPKFA
jgi:membrane protein DedA with SNARE-associated domain/rhodanese-related sulfurtransferase